MKNDDEMPFLIDPRSEEYWRIGKLEEYNIGQQVNEQLQKEKDKKIQKEKDQQISKEEYELIHLEKDVYFVKGERIHLEEDEATPLTDEEMLIIKNNEYLEFNDDSYREPFGTPPEIAEYDFYFQCDFNILHGNIKTLRSITYNAKINKKNQIVKGKVGSWLDNRLVVFNKQKKPIALCYYNPNGSVQVEMYHKYDKMGYLVKSIFNSREFNAIYEYDYDIEYSDDDSATVVLYSERAVRICYKEREIEKFKIFHRKSKDNTLITKNLFKQKKKADERSNEIRVLNEEGIVIKRTLYRNDEFVVREYFNDYGKLKVRETSDFVVYYTYNKNNILIRKEKVSFIYSKYSKVVLYDRLVRNKHYFIFNEDDQKTSYTEYNYDSYGNLVTINSKNFELNREICTHFEYRYDKYNNWYKSFEFVDGKPNSITERQIEYI